jgi:hypothetical protein
MKHSRQASSCNEGSKAKIWGEYLFRFGKALLLTVLMALVSAGALHAQEDQGSSQQSTFQFGPLKIDVKGVFEVEFNDNINYSNSDKQSDIILRPGIVLAATCPLTEFNTFSLQMGISYEDYLIHHDLSSYSNFAEVSPDSKLSFSMRFNNFTLTVYDSFNYSVTPTDAFDVNPSTLAIITNLKAFGQFMNQLGVNGNWDLGKVVLYGGVYRYDVFPQQSEFSFLRRWQYTASAGARYQFDNGMSLKLDASYTLNYYQQNLENNSKSWYIGPTLAGPLGKNWTFSATVGFTDYQFLDTGTNGDTSQPVAYTGELSVSNKTTKTLNQTLTLTQASSFGYTSNTIKIDRISYKADWLAQAKVDLILFAYWERGADSGGIDPEIYNKFDISPEVDWNYSKRTSFYAYYEFTDKFSNIDGRSYTRDRMVFGLRYQF